MPRTIRAMRAPQRPQRRRRDWARNSIQQNFASAGPPVAFDLLGAWAAQVGATLPGLTCGPVIARASIDGITGAAYAQLYWGIIVANREAIAGSIASYDPSQVADRTLDWMLWESTAVLETDGIFHTVIRTNSMRKLEDVGQSLYFIGRATTATVRVHASFSTLVLLP